MQNEKLQYIGSHLACITSSFLDFIGCLDTLYFDIHESPSIIEVNDL